MSYSNHDILYTNESRSVFVIDIPASISLAQGYDSTVSLPSSDRRLISCPPVVRQYHLPESKIKFKGKNESSKCAAGCDGGENEGYLQRGNEERCRKTSVTGKVRGNTVEDIEHGRYRELITGALVEIQENYGGPLCGARCLRGCKVWDGESNDYGFECTNGRKEIKDKELRTMKDIKVEEEENKREERQAQVADAEESVDLDTLLGQLCESEIIASEARFSYLLGPSPLSEFDDRDRDEGLESKDYCQNDIYQIWEGFLHNSKDYIRPLLISDDRNKTCSSNNGGNSADSISFYIPPHSTFLLNSCNDTASFHAAVRNMSNGPENNRSTSRQFDLIVLDPPWPNASAKRKRKSKNKHTSGSYITQPNLKGIRNLLYGMDLDRLIAPNGLIAIWITNKPAVRTLVLGPGGLFEQLNVRLLEEWVWVKVTCGGEAVTPLAGSWRKPYEVLLLARAPADQLDSVVHEREREREWQQGSASSKGPEVKHRVLVAVPDLHSRKPCLKSLLEPMVGTGKPDEMNGSAKQKRKAYTCRALEIFARHLVAGWWSWGDQVLLYQWEGSWSSSEVMIKGKKGETA